MGSRSIFQSFQSKQGLPVSRPSAAAAAANGFHNNNNNNKNISNEKGEADQGQRGGGVEVGIRRRLSSLSLKIQELQPSPSSTSISMSYIMGSFRRSKSMSSMGAEYAGNSIRKWWDWGWGWILSRKPTFAQDLEMNEQEMGAIGSHNKGSWRHVFFKLKFESGKLLRGSSHNMVLPQTVRSSYS